MGEIKIFKLNDCDWWAGEDLDSVKSAYLSEMDITDPQGIESAFDDPRELFDEEMDQLKFDGDDRFIAKVVIDSTIRPHGSEQSEGKSEKQPK
jgi:hypothetical protein